MIIVWIRYGAGIVLLALSALIAFGNWACILDYYWKRHKGIKEHHSLIHFFGPISFLLGFVILPLKVSPYFLFCVFLDPTFLFIPVAVVALIRGSRDHQDNTNQRAE